MDIYENPSEHYASINNYGVGFSGSGLQAKEGTSGPNFYGYGVEDYETSDYEAGPPMGGLKRVAKAAHRPSSSVLGDRWADSSHSETDHDSDNNNRLNKR